MTWIKGVVLYINFTAYKKRNEKQLVVTTFSNGVQICSLLVCASGVHEWPPSGLLVELQVTAASSQASTVHSSAALRRDIRVLQRSHVLVSLKDVQMNPSLSSVWS